MSPTQAVYLLVVRRSPARRRRLLAQPSSVGRRLPSRCRRGGGFAASRPCVSAVGAFVRRCRGGALGGPALPVDSAAGESAAGCRRGCALPRWLAATPPSLKQLDREGAEQIQMAAVTIVIRVNRSPALVPKALWPPMPPNAPANPPPRPALDQHQQDQETATSGTTEPSADASMHRIAP